MKEEKQKKERDQDREKEGGGGGEAHQTMLHSKAVKRRWVSKCINKCSRPEETKIENTLQFANTVCRSVGLSVCLRKQASTNE